MDWPLDFVLELYGNNVCYEEMYNCFSSILRHMYYDSFDMDYKNSLY